MNKSELLEALETNHEQFLSLVEGVAVEELEQPGVMGEWSVKDIMSHLLIWEAETIKLLFMAHINRKPDTAHFKTISDDEQNAIWYNKFKDRPYELVWQDYATIRDQTIERIAEFSDADLTNPSRYPWLQGRSLCQILESFILEHEAEHTAALKLWREKRDAG